MTTANATEEVKRLQDLINHHNNLYFQQLTPKITDLEFDKLKAELDTWRQRAPEAFEDEPTIGEKPSGALQPAKHTQPMLSLDNTYSEADLRKFILKTCEALGDPTGNNTVWAVEYKVDGAAVSLEYQDGKLAIAISRGNGDTGDDITHNVAAMTGIPTEINAAGPTLIRGEAFIHFEDLVEINKQRLAAGEPVLKNTRNAASGAIRLRSAEECRQRRVSFFPHGLIQTDSNRSDDNYLDACQEVYQDRFQRIPGSVMALGIESAVAAANTLTEIAPTLSFAIDGVVLKLNSFRQRQELGEHSSAPRWAIAYKIIKIQKPTKVLNIVWQVGKTGVITPVAELEPVDIDGSTVSRATLHNATEMRSKDIRIGDTVLVEKAGMVIPYVSGVDLSLRTPECIIPEIPLNCPACGEPATQESGYVAIKCINTVCKGKLAQRLLHFTSRDAMDIEGLGDVLAESMVASGVVQDVLDLFTLTREQLIQQAAAGPKTADKLLANIQASKSRGLARFLYSLSIPLVGQRASLAAATKYNTLDALYTAFESEDEISVDGLVGVACDSLRAFVSSDYGHIVRQRARQLGIFTEVPDSEKVDTSGVLAGKTIVVTGTMVKFDRSEIEATIAKLGGKAGSSVSKKTTFVVAGDKAGSKLDKAKQLGIPVLTEDEFLTMIGS